MGSLYDDIISFWVSVSEFYYGHLILFWLLTSLCYYSFSSVFYCWFNCGYHFYVYWFMKLIFFFEIHYGWSLHQSYRVKMIMIICYILRILIDIYFSDFFLWTLDLLCYLFIINLIVILIYLYNITFFFFNSLWLISLHQSYRVKYNM